MNTKSVIGTAAVAFSLAHACATAAAEPSQWRLTARCATGAERLLPGEGLFEVREKSRDGNLEAIDIRGCGKNRKFHRTFEVGGDDVGTRVYGLPFFSKDHLDILIEQTWEDGSSYWLFRAVRKSNKTVATFDEAVISFASVGGLYFGAADSDGRWGMRLEHIDELSCGTDKADKEWSAAVDKEGHATLTAFTICPSMAISP